MTTKTPTGFERATAADPQLRALADFVTALCAFVRPADTMCGGCAWEDLVKPLATHLIGRGRGYPPKPAQDLDPHRPLRIASGTEWRTNRQEAAKTRPPATSETERWLRSSQAWDAYCGELIQRLNDADPAHGHGIHRNGRASKTA